MSEMRSLVLFDITFGYRPYPALKLGVSLMAMKMHLTFCVGYLRIINLFVIFFPGKVCRF